MKNQLESWEIGLSEKVQSHEFDFDEGAFADFEQLFAAEAVVSVDQAVAEGAGNSVTQAYGAASVSTAGTSGKLAVSTLIKILLIGGAGLTIGILLTYYVTNSANDSTSNSELPAVTFSPVLPPSGPNPSATLDGTTLAEDEAVADASGNLASATTGLISEGTSSGSGVSTNVENVKIPTPALDLPVSSENEGKVELKPAIPQAVYLLPRRGIDPLPARLPALNLSKIQVRKSTPPKTSRDRRTLFPDVIDH